MYIEIMAGIRQIVAGVGLSCDQLGQHIAGGAHHMVHPRVVIVCMYTRWW